MRRSLFLFFYLLFPLSVFGQLEDGTAPPNVLDDRLVLEEFVSHPDLTTPTGIAVTSDGKVLVVECHTHFPPDDYQGLKHDRVLWFQDTDGDGKADKKTVFFEGTTQTMNLAVHPNGDVFLATRRSVLILRDLDEDGIADENKTIVHLITEGNYPHNGISGFSFNEDGDVFFGLGENLGKDYSMVGSDGSVVSGGGEGGSIFRMKADGARLVRYATGFWNPYRTTIDAFGRMFMVDNDADSRPPCRLNHVVANGDYGYRFKYGRKGLHPYTAWNGENPGMLPMASGVGDGPSGVLAYESTHLPSDYLGGVFVTAAWIHNRLEFHQLVPAGASFRTKMTTVIQGDDNFRPISITTAPDGSLYMTDWVDKSYNIHGFGRVWRIRSREATSGLPQTTASDRQRLLHHDQASRRLAAQRLARGSEAELEYLEQIARSYKHERIRVDAILALDQIGGVSDALADLLIQDEHQRIREVAVTRLRLTNSQLVAVLAGTSNDLVKAAAWRKVKVAASGESYQLLENTLASSDSFLRQAARQSMLNEGSGIDLTKPFDMHQSIEVQLAVILNQQLKAPDTLTASLDRLLRHPDERLRFVALKWIGDNVLTQWLDVLNDELFSIATSEKLIQTTLATIDLLEGKSPVELDKTGSELFAQRILENQNASLDLKQYAIRNISATHALGTVPALTELLANNEDAIAREVIAKLQVHPDGQAQNAIRGIAENRALTPNTRALAVAAMHSGSKENVDSLISLSGDTELEVAEEAYRSINGYIPLPEQILTLKRNATTEYTKELLDRILSAPNITEERKNRSLEQWSKILKPGNPQRGERIFYNGQAGTCFQCHQVKGRGNSVGPDLSRIAATLSYEKILESIIQPSRNIAPRFQSWKIVLEDGRLVTGMQVGEDREGNQFYVDSSGKQHTVVPSEIDVKQADDVSIMPQDLIKNLTEQELADVISFLVTLKGDQ